MAAEAIACAPQLTAGEPQVMIQVRDLIVVLDTIDVASAGDEHATEDRDRGRGPDVLEASARLALRAASHGSEAALLPSHGLDGRMRLATGCFSREADGVHDMTKEMYHTGA